MSKYKGQIADFPEEIVEKILKRQKEQTGKKDVTIFERSITATSVDKGFDWDNTKEGEHFWADVLYRRYFSVFFQKYPKKQKFKKGDKVKVVRMPVPRDFYGLSKERYEKMLGNIFTVAYFHDDKVTFENGYTVHSYILEKIEEETHNFKVGDKVVVYKLPDDKSEKGRVHISINKYKKWLNKEFTILSIYDADSGYPKRALLFDIHYHVPISILKKVDEYYIEAKQKEYLQAKKVLREKSINKLIKSAVEKETDKIYNETFYNWKHKTLELERPLPEIKIRKKRIKISLD